MDIFWKIIENLNWDGDYERCKKYLLDNYSKEDIDKLESTFNNLFKDLNSRFEEEWLDKIPVGDDGWCDLRAEVIGRGKEFFDNITVDKLIKMGETDDYAESFAYVFPHKSDYEEQPKPPSYPEHEKLSEIKEQSQFTGELIEFLQEKGYLFAKYEDVGLSEPRLVPQTISINKILAEMFDIDLIKIEEEKRQMIGGLSN